MALWGISTPNFWLGILLIFLFSVHLGWLPASGYVPLVRGSARLLARPDHAGLRARQLVRRRADAPHPQRHAAGAEQDYVRTARAKGLPERFVVLKHALRNALIPVVTLGALDLGALLSGAVLTEQVFSIPGFGKLIVDACSTATMRWCKASSW